MRILTLLLGLVPSLAAAAPQRVFRIEQVYQVKPLPAGASTAELFVPIPSEDPWQRVRGLEIKGASFSVVHDTRFGNQAARLQMPASGGEVRVTYEITRLERSADVTRATGREAPSGYEPWLASDALVPVSDRVRKIAADVTKGKSTPLAKARAIYDYVLSTMRYEKKGEGWGRGDIMWACDMKYGNCTDFHALFIGLLRAKGIPARFQIGYSVPEVAAAELPGYHCWADFYIDGVGWIPVDASEAWKNKDKRDYFFGHHDANRFALSTGRDIVLPGMRGQALNYFVFAYGEVGGKPFTDIGRKTRMVSLPESKIQSTERHTSIR